MSRWGNHWITGLWWHFGQFGDQDVHVHSCLGPADVINAAMDAGTDTHLRDYWCDWVVIGLGRNCPGTGEPEPTRRRHWMQNLAARVDATTAWDDYQDEAAA